MRTSAAVPPGARLSRRNSSSRRGSDAAMHLGCRGLARRRSRQAVDRSFEQGTVGAEPGRQRLEEGDARTGFQLGIERENFAGKRHA